MTLSTRPINYVLWIAGFLFLSLIVTVTSLLFLKFRLSEHHQLILDRIHALIPAERLNSSVQTYVASERGFLLTGNPEFIERLEIADQQFKSNLHELSDWIRTTKGEEYLERIIAADRDHTASVEVVHKMRAQQGLSPAVTKYFETEVYPRRRVLQNVVDLLVQHKEQALLQTEHESEISSARTVTLILLSATLSIVSCSFLCFLMARRLQSLYRSASESENTIRGMASELARSNAELERFASIASHDLRAPLKTIHSYGQLLKRNLAETGDLKSVEYAAVVIEGAAKLHGLVDDLLDFARVNHTEKTLEKVDLNSVVQEVEESLRGEIDSSHTRLVYSALPEVTGVRTLFIQLFSNLIANAIRYRSEKNPVVQISSREESDAWCVSVTDNGIGIDMKYAQQIFEPFKRLHSYEKIPGSGLGLSICRSAIEKIGGKIWVKSQPDAGTTFYLEIPKIQNAEAKLA